MAGFSRTALQTGIPFGVVMFVVLMLSSDGALGSSLVFGAASGATFGFLMASFAEYQHRKFADYDPTGPGEELLRQAGANHWKNKESVGGYLYLTDERLVFVSHKVNLQNHELSIPLEEISSVHPRRTMFVVPNGLEVVRGEDKERFVVNDRRGWTRELQARLPKQGS